MTNSIPADSNEDYKDSESSVQEIFEFAGYECRSYSGRSMYGKTCLGVEVDNLGEFFANIISALTDDVTSDNSTTTAAVIEAFGNMKTDSMGLGVIIYFPDVKFKHEEKDDLED
jgi:hypothetical protein